MRRLSPDCRMFGRGEYTFDLFVMIDQVLEKLDLNDTTVQHVLLASIPQLPDLAMPQVLPTHIDSFPTLA